MAAFGEVHQPTWVFLEELLFAQMNDNLMRNGEHHRLESHRISTKTSYSRRTELTTATKYRPKGEISET